MLATPGTFPDLGYELTRTVAERLARNWWIPPLEGLLLVVAGVLIFSIHWGERSLATFIGALFIVEGVANALAGGIDATVRRTNAVIGVLSVAAGVAIIAWPSPGLTVVAVFLGSWLIVVGTLTIAGSFAARRILPS